MYFAGKRPWVYGRTQYGFGMSVVNLIRALLLIPSWQPEVHHRIIIYAPPKILFNDGYLSCVI